MAYYDRYPNQSRRSRSRDSSMRRPGPSRYYPSAPQPPVVTLPDPPESRQTPQQHHEPQQGYGSSGYSYTPQNFTYIPPTSSFSGGSRSSRSPSPDPPPIYPYRNAHDEFDHASSTYAYVAVDPFRPSIVQPTPAPSQTPIIPAPIPNQPSQIPYDYSQFPAGFTPFPYIYTPAVNTPEKGLISLILLFFFDTIPRQLYLHFLLRLPAFYFSRVARIFEEAEMTMPEIKKMALTHSGRKYDAMALQPADSNLKVTWETFIDTLLLEWKTLNIVSVLLLSAILTILQIEAAAADPITRYAALFSLICALMSLLYGCLYIIRFGTMKKTHKAAEWAEEGQKSKTVIFWNVWVLLAMPAAWLGWSIILYIVCIMSFVWRTGTANTITSSTLSSKAVLGPRIAISAVLGLGALYFLLILNTFRRYGDTMDKAWQARVAGWRQILGHGRRWYNTPSNHSRDNRDNPLQYSEEYSSSSRLSYPSTPFQPPLPNVPRWEDLPPVVPVLNTLPPSSNFSNFFIPAKILDLRFQHRGDHPMPAHLVNRDIKYENWERFISEVSRSWDIGISNQRRNRRDIPSRPQDIVAEVIEKWNMKFFVRRGTKALLCQEYLQGFPDSPAFSVYLIDWSSLENMPLRLVDRFSAVPEGLERIDIFDPPTLYSSRSRILGRTSIFSTRHPREGRVHFGVSLRSTGPAQEPPVAPHPMARAPYESSRRSYSRSPSPLSIPTHYQDDRLRPRGRSREPSPRNRRPHHSHSPPRRDITASPELLPSSWSQSQVSHHETVEILSRRERRRGSLPTIEVTYDTPNQSSQLQLQSRTRTSDIPQTPAVVSHPPSGNRPRSRPVSMLSPLSLALRSSIRRRDSIDTPYQSDASSLAYQRRHSVEPSEGNEDSETDPQGHREITHHDPTLLAPNTQFVSPQAPSEPDADAVTNALAGPWMRDLASLQNLTTR